MKPVWVAASTGVAYLHAIPLNGQIMSRRQLLPLFLMATLIGPSACDQATSVSPMSSATKNGSGIVEAAVTAAAVSPSTIHGTDFFMKTQEDNNFCAEVESGTTEGRTITLQQCGVADTQRWAFSDNADGTNNILDSQGMCLNGRFVKANLGLALPVGSCEFSGTWQFVYTSTGLIQNVRNGKCLAVAGAAANAPVSLQDCDATKAIQRWLVTH